MENSEEKTPEQTANQSNQESQLPPRFVLRCIILCLGLAVMALGVAFSIKSNLGTSPISSLPYVISLISPLTVGTATILMHCVLILLQIIILRRRYQLIQLLQLPVALIFGYLTDFFVMLINGLTYKSYWQQWIYCIIGILLVALGVTIEVLAKVVTLAGEGLVLAICRVAPIKFGNMKIIFDVTLVISAGIISLIFLGGLYGVREGTIAAALLVGACSKQMTKPLSKVEERLLS